MHQNDLLTLFRRSGALLEGHFRLSSGLHSPGYLQCALVLADPRDASTIGDALGNALKQYAANVVLSPALGGVIIGHEVGRALGIRAIFAERQDNGLALRRGFSLGPGDKVIVVEDVLTTGLSTRETMEVAKAAGAKVVAACAMIDRSAGNHNLDVPFHALLPMRLPTYQPESCPLCGQGLPLVKPGSRK